MEARNCRHGNGAHVTFATSFGAAARYAYPQGGTEMTSRGRILIVRMALWAALTVLGTSVQVASANTTQISGQSSTGNEGAGASVPMQTDIAAGELTRIEQEIVSLTRQRDSIIMEEQASRSFEPVRPVVQQLKSAAASYCNAAPAARADFERQLRALSQRLSRISSDVPRAYPWEFSEFDAASSCPNGPAAFLDEIEAALSASPAGNRAQIDDRLRHLRERRAEVIREMSEGVAGARIAKNIPWLMLIIFGLGAAILAGLKLFAPEIQHELVGSGQIVQFVTILILLGVILALGLAERLEGETLGTLLGGLAGYVLSQGIGRQTQQRFLSAIRSATSGGSKETT